MLALIRRNPEFRRLFAAHAVSRAGDAFNTVAIVVLVFDLTGSGLGVSGAVAFEVIPVLLLGPFAGLVVDRLPRRSVMIGADAIRAVAALTIAVWHGSVAVAFATAFFLSLGAVAFNPAAASVMPLVVRDDEVITANSALWSVAVLSQIVLAPTAGAIIAVYGVTAAFAVNAASFVLSAGILWRLRAARDRADAHSDVWAGVLAGVKTARAHPLLRRLAVVQVLASLSAGATGGLLVVLAERRLDIGPAGFGLLLSFIGLGAVAGPALLRNWIVALDRRWLFGPFVVRGVADLVLASTRSPVVAGGALSAYGVSTSTGMVAYQSTLQLAVPPHVRGRVFALFDVLWNAARLVSLGLGGLLVELVGVRWVYAVGGALLLAAAAVGLGTRVETLSADAASAEP